MTIEEKIKGINITPSSSMLKPLCSGTAIDIETFWKDVVEPLLPDYKTMKKWHNLLIDYVENLPDPVVYMIRKGNEETKKYIEDVRADALRRGFLTKTDSGYWFVYNDNDFATYMLAMVLDGDIIDSLNAMDLLEYLRKPGSIIRFNKSGKDGVEIKRAYFKINGTRPCISQNGYTVAHIFDVNSHYYDKSLGFRNIGGEDALKSLNLDKGMYSDYILQESNNGSEIYYRDNYHPGDGARKFLKAYTLRFLHPLNFFCAPKDNNNGYVYCEFTDHINNGKPGTRRFRRISGYEHVLYYAHHKFKEKYGDIYDDFLQRIMLPDNTFDFFEKSSATPDFYASERICAQYANPLSSGSSKQYSSAQRNVAAPKRPIYLTNINKSYLDTFKVGEIANQVLRAIIKSGVDSGKMSKADIDRFKTEKGPTSVFKLSLPLLSLDREDANGVKRYYKDPIECYGEKLYLNSQWPKEKKDLLIKWSVDWAAANGGNI